MYNQFPTNLIRDVILGEYYKSVTIFSTNNPYNKCDEVLPIKFVVKKNIFGGWRSYQY